MRKLEDLEGDDRLIDVHLVAQDEELFLTEENLLLLG